MDQLNFSFWLGLAAAIPLSVLANLFTPRVQQWVGRRNSVKAERQIALLRGQLDELERLTSEPGRLQTFLLENILAITLFTSMFGVLSGLFFTFANLLPGGGRLFLPLGQLLAVGGGSVVAKECFSTLRKSSQARNIEKFKAKVSTQIAELQ